MEYINFSKNKQTSFLRLTKIRTNLTWKQIAHFLEFEDESGFLKKLSS